MRPPRIPVRSTPMGLGSESPWKKDSDFDSGPKPGLQGTPTPHYITLH